MLKPSSARFLFIAAAVFLVVTFGFFVRPTHVATWPTANAPAALSEDYLGRHGQDASTQEKTVDVSDEYLVPPLASIASSSSASAPALTATSTSNANPAASTSSVTEQYGSQETPQHAVQELDASLSNWTVVSGKMRKDRKYMPIDFGDYGSYNPNLLPHPWKNDTWVMIAQGAQTPGEAQGPIYSIELVCDAILVNDTLKCARSPTTVPIASTVSTHCTGGLEWFNLFIGPNDPRVFYGPDKPYITYGSASQYTCLGQWIHDLRRLVRWNDPDVVDSTKRFFWPTELQRPAPYGDIEKNWFAFWDHAGEMYLHYDIYPNRTFARINHDGSEVSEDLAPLTAATDSVCLQKYMPELKEAESIHQATNSLAITMCKRDDQSCHAKQNTFIFTIFHHKQYHGHNIYEPYIMMIRQEPPFDIYAISSKPFWINGRGMAGDSSSERPADQTQMMYMTSMSWLAQNMTYHGYLDDELFISFGIEDKAAGAIDVVAGDLIKDMHLCT